MTVKAVEIRKPVKILKQRPSSPYMYRLWRLLTLWSCKDCKNCKDTSQYTTTNHIDHIRHIYHIYHVQTSRSIYHAHAYTYFSSQYGPCYATKVVHPGTAALERRSRDEKECDVRWRRRESTGLIFSVHAPVDELINCWSPLSEATFRGLLLRLHRWWSWSAATVGRTAGWITRETRNSQSWALLTGVEATTFK